MRFTIVGGGFGGVKTALEIAKNPRNHVTVITDKTDLQFYPALYSTATGKSRLQSWIPLGLIFSDKSNIDVLIDKVDLIDPLKKKVFASSGNSYEYEKIIISLGSVTTYFGIPGLDRYAFGIKSEHEIEELKRHLFHEMAEGKIAGKRYVVIGGGPTGVELAASLGSYIRRLRKRYKLPHARIGITLVEAAPRLLPKMHPQTSKKVTKQLRRMGVSVELNKKVEKATVDGITINGHPLSSHTVIWTSGVANNPFFEKNSQFFEFSRNGKVVVDEYMKTKEGVYVIGDNAFTPYSGLAQTALYDAQFIAKNIRRLQQKKPLRKYRPMQPALVVPVGDRWAAFEWHFIRFYGRPASFIRRIADMIGYLDFLPVSQALSVWKSQEEYQEDYFTPSSRTK